MEVIHEEPKEDTFFDEGEEEEDDVVDNYIVFLSYADKTDENEATEVEVSDTKPCEFKIEELQSMHI